MVLNMKVGLNIALVSIAAIAAVHGMILHSLAIKHSIQTAKNNLKMCLLSLFKFRNVISVESKKPAQ